MPTAIKSAYLREDYLAFDDTAEMKHEFYQGEIFAMAGGTFNHAKISGQTFSTLSVKLRGKSCGVMNSDLRLSTPSGLDTYPDLSAFCGKPILTDNQRTLLNSVMIIEVLSPSTRRYDQSDKFTLYRSIPTFSDYLLVDSEKIYVQHFHKVGNYEWLLHEYFELTDNIYLSSLSESISLVEMYEGVTFD